MNACLEQQTFTGSSLKASCVSSPSIKRWTYFFQEAPIGKNGDNVDLDTPDMRQPIAWEFALLAVRRQEEAEARRALGQGLDKRVRDVEVICSSKAKMCLGL